MEVIILAGGLGTRLQGVIGAYPKCMAEVDGRPFLAHLFDYIDRQGCTRAILSLGFKHEVVIEWLEKQDLRFEVDCVIENEPLGTGGGIMAAMGETVTDDIAVLNGDTMFTVNLRDLFRTHRNSGSVATLALKEMHDFDRYGVVNIDGKGIITSFEEKQFRKQGLINGGIYIITREEFLGRKLPAKFSFEKDYLECFVGDGKFHGQVIDSYFIDIGVPDDYSRAQTDFKTLFA